VPPAFFLWKSAEGLAAFGPSWGCTFRLARGAAAGLANATGRVVRFRGPVSLCSAPRAERSTTVRFTLRSQSMTARIFVESVEVTKLTYLSGEVTSLSSCQWANSRPSPKRPFRDM
jgi:hypothetical protein